MMIYSLTPQENFSPLIEVASALIEQNGEFLFVKRAPHKSYPGTYSLPGGKVEEGETAKEALLRELHEELGATYEDKEFSFLHTLYIRAEVDFIFHVFHYLENHTKKITLNDEHTDYAYIGYEELANYPLIRGGALLLDFILQKNGPSSKKI